MALNIFCKTAWGRGPSVERLCIPLVSVTVRGFRPAWHRPFVDPKHFENVEYPPDGNRLSGVPKTPFFTQFDPPKLMTKKLIDMRGPERVHNTLLHKQYGVQALTGGNLRGGHFDMIRTVVNSKLNPKTMFAIYRIDPPWKPVTRKGAGHKMGKGKGAIHHYVTPVRAGRIIIEMGGKMEYFEVEHFLHQVAHNLPFPARPVTHEMLLADAEEEERIERENINPITFSYGLKHNSFGVTQNISPYDYIWHNKYR